MRVRIWCKPSYCATTLCLCGLLHACMVDEYNLQGNTWCGLYRYVWRGGFGGCGYCWFRVFGGSLLQYWFRVFGGSLLLV